MGKDTEDGGKHPCVTTTDTSLRKLDYSIIGNESLLRVPGNRDRLSVLLKFKAPAAFYKPDNAGRKWSGTSGKNGGGYASIICLHKDGNGRIPVVKWNNYLGHDGLNCRIVAKLPIQRGNAGEFFFKSASTTNAGSRCKTVFALKFVNENDADEFHMWWLQFNGQIGLWIDAANNNKDVKEAVYDNDCPTSLLEDIVNIDPHVFDVHRNLKRKLPLTSPPAVSGVGKSFDFPSPDAKPSAKQRVKLEPINNCVSSLNSGCEALSLKSPLRSDSFSSSSSHSLSQLSIKTETKMDNDIKTEDKSDSTITKEEVIIDDGPTVMSQKLTW